MTIFSRIIAGEIPCYKIAETENCFAFLDINPLVKGHVLCIPKREVDYLFDLTDQELCDLQLFAKKIAVALRPSWVLKYLTHTSILSPCSLRRICCSAIPNSN